MEDNTNNQKLQVFERLSKGNKFVFYIYRKISKISGAIYLITDIIKDVEPLKWRLRKTATDTLSLKNFFGDKAVFNTLEEHLFELESMLELARLSGVVSEMNALIVGSEVRKLLTEIRERSKEGFYVPELVPSFFEVAKPESLSLEEYLARSKELDDKGHKGQSVRYDLYNPKQASKPYSRELSAQPDTSESKGQRRDEILRIIKARGSVTIKDITESVRDCSEKTVQRELMSLVDSKLVKKTGERRWSKYSPL